MLRLSIHAVIYSFLAIFKSTSISSNWSLRRLRLAVKTIAAWENNLSTGALDGIAVLNLMNNFFIWGYLFNIDIDVSVSRK